MKKTILSALLAVGFVSFANASNRISSSDQKVVTKPHTVLTKTVKQAVKPYRLALWQETVGCPPGSGGPGYTYWVVYDDATGAIVGAGRTGFCLEESLA